MKKSILALLAINLFITILNNLKLKKMANEMDDLVAAVNKDTEVDQSAITLLEGLKSKLDAAIAGNDMTAIKALADQLGTNQQKLADAVLANTPAAEE